MTSTVARNAKPQAAQNLTPRVDVLESDNGFTLLIDLPGVKPDGVDVQFENGELAVKAKREQREPMEFSRSFRINDQIAADKIEAELKHGVLHLTLPKIDALKPRRIAVRG